MTILASLAALAETLGHDAQLVAETTGDRAVYRREGLPLEALYEEYWARTHSIAWLSAYFTVPAARRPPGRVTDVLEAARERFLAAARSREGYRRYVAELPAAARTSSTRRAATWRVFDGARRVAIALRGAAEVRALVDDALRAAPAAAPPADASDEASNEPRDAALDAAIAEDPEDPARYAVLGDWLTERGDPRGELIALSIAEAAAPTPAARARLGKQIAALRARHPGRFAGGSLAAHRANHDGFGGDPFTWRNGFIHTACIRCSQLDPARPVDVVRDVLAHPSGRFVVELHVTHERPGPIDLQPVIDLVCARAPALRALRMPESNLWARYVHTGSFARAWPALAQLRALTLAGDFELGAIALPHVARVSLGSPAWTRAAIRAIAGATWPALTELTLHLGDPPRGIVGELAAAIPALPRGLARLTVTGIDLDARAALARACAPRGLAVE